MLKRIYSKTLKTYRHPISRILTITTKFLTYVKVKTVYDGYRAMSNLAKCKGRCYILMDKEVLKRLWQWCKTLQTVGLSTFYRRVTSKVNVKEKNTHFNFKSIQILSRHTVKHLIHKFEKRKCHWPERAWLNNLKKYITIFIQKHYT